jgi:hypothetical protein
MPMLFSFDAARRHFLSLSPIFSSAARQPAAAPQRRQRYY